MHKTSQTRSIIPIIVAEKPILILNYSSGKTQWMESFAADLAERDDAFLRSHAAAAQHDVVLLALAIVREAAERSDHLLRRVVLRRRVVLHHLAVLRVLTLQSIRKKSAYS